MNLLETALAALDAGLAPWPPREDGTKAPTTEVIPAECTMPACVELREAEKEGWAHRQHVRADPALLGQLYANGRTGFGLICGGVSGGLELFEFEGRAANAGIVEEFAAAADATGLGHLVARISGGYAEVTPTGGIHLLYRCATTKTEKLARSPEGVLIETKGEGGFVIVAPSSGTVHPSGGAWELRSGGLDTIVTISEEERAELHRLARTFDQMPKPAARTHRPVRTAANGDSVWEVTPWEDFDARVSWEEILEPHGWRRLFCTSGGNLHWWHGQPPHARTSATVNEDGAGPTLYVFSSSTPFEPDTAYGRFGAWAVLNHGEDYKAASAALEAQGYGRRRERAEGTRVSSGAKSAPAVSGPESVLPLGAHLPEDFWRGRPALGHIRQAARARLVSPDAVFGAVLARVAAITPHTVELPAIVGSPLGLTFYTAVVGAPEAGKSAAVGVAAEMVPAPDRVVDGLPIGSGEGMVETLFEWVEETDDEGKVRKVKKQTRHGAIFRIDEGSVLGDLGGRRGSTLLPTLRSAYTSGPLGNANASAETRRILAGGTYVYGVVMGLQPELAGPLLADADAGTPQRFVWVSATDPGAPDEAGEWPGPLEWRPPASFELERYAVTSGGWLRHRLEVAPAVRAEIREERLAVMRGAVERAPLDAHGTLSRLKVAALLGLLDQRCDVTEDDWHLAGIVATTSRRVRAGVEAVLEGTARRKEHAAVERHARRELHVEDSKEQRALMSAAKSVARATARHAEGHEHGDRGCAPGCLTRAIAGKHRVVVTVPDVIAEAERHGWIRPDGDLWLPGESRPA